VEATYYLFTYLKTIPMAIKKSTDENAKEGMPFNEEKDGTVSSSDLQKLDKAGFTPEQMKVIEDLQRQIAESNANNAEVSMALREEGIINPVDDYLDEPAMFFSFSSWFGIYSDKRFNREVMPPRDEPIKFEKLYRYQKNKNARGVEVISVSQAVVRSKETAEWLREHTLFNIKFFENLKAAQNVNVTLAEKMSEMNNVVNSMNDHFVVERCKREGISVATADLRELRKMLIRKLADDAMMKEKHVREIKMKGDFDENDRKIEKPTELGNIDTDLQTTSVY
jgi:hypothetical protein